MKKFFDLFKEHKADIKDFHDAVSAWHDADTTDTVFEYLGMTEKEYAIFVRHPEKAESLRNKKFESAGSFLARLRF